jgi:hypothetical protein
MSNKSGSLINSFFKSRKTEEKKEIELIDLASASCKVLFLV